MVENWEVTKNLKDAYIFFCIVVFFLTILLTFKKLYFERVVDAIRCDQKCYRLAKRCVNVRSLPVAPSAGPGPGRPRCCSRCRSAARALGTLRTQLALRHADVPFCLVTSCD